MKKADKLETVADNLNSPFEWRDVPEVVMSTFMAMHGAIVDLKEEISERVHPEQLKEFVYEEDFNEVTQNLADKVSNLALEVDSRPTVAEIEALEEILVTREDLEIAMNSIPNPVRISDASPGATEDLSAHIRDLRSEIESMNRTIHSRLGSQDSKMAEMNDDLSRRPSLVEISDLLEEKIGRDVLDSAMNRKPNRGEIDLQMAKKADRELVDQMIDILKKKVDLTDFQDLKSDLGDGKSMRSPRHSILMRSEADVDDDVCVTSRLVQIEHEILTFKQDVQRALTEKVSLATVDQLRKEATQKLDFEEAQIFIDDQKEELQLNLDEIRKESQENQNTFRSDFEHTLKKKVEDDIIEIQKDLKSVREELTRTIGKECEQILLMFKYQKQQMKEEWETSIKTVREDLVSTLMTKDGFSGTKKEIETDLNEQIKQLRTSLALSGKNMQNQFDLLIQAFATKFQAENTTKIESLRSEIQRDMNS